ncbi:hypothetical protein BX600DRAFT_471401 [Xylariales sp. PMI_506]|nr:hypothetical protein BX600DRAFT_471401 [Xylariales sp. PMI_506]
MYRWYEQAKVCYAYLSDVPSEGNAAKKALAFAHSRWFTRGWTLQELLAPKELLFYGESWEPMGDRTSLAAVLARITGIARIYINRPEATVSMAPVALKLSWAARRETLREEDQAYCLMGLLNVHMPLLYGEGTQAFRRLQEEIIRVRYDQTLLAWGLAGPSNLFTNWLGTPPLLASSPASFHSWNLKVMKLGIEGPHYVMTNLGILLELPIITLDPDGKIALGLLECGVPSAYSNGTRVAVPLHIQKRKGAGAPLAFRATGAWPFLAPEGVAASATRANVYLNRGIRHNIQIDSAMVRWSAMNDRGFRLADYFPAELIAQASSHSALIDRRATQILMRFVHAHLGDVLLLYWRDPSTPDKTAQILCEHAYLATADKFSTSWELVLQPKFEKIDFEQLRKSISWSSQITVTKRQESESEESNTKVNLRVVQITNSAEKITLAIEEEGVISEKPTGEGEGELEHE